MKQIRLTGYITAVVMAIATLTAYASDPQMFVYRNDSVFNSTHLRSGVNVTHSTSGSPTIHIQDENGDMINIPMSSVDSCVLRVADIPRCTSHFRTIRMSRTSGARRSMSMRFSTSKATDTARIRMV